MINARPSAELPADLSAEALAKADGYVLLGITIILVIMGIFLGAAVPIWQHVMQREREEELIWRGMQYVQAIELYQKKHPGGFPPNLEILVEQKFLRKLYKDPMAEDGEWKVLRQLSPELRRLTPRPGGGGSGPGQQEGGEENRPQMPPPSRARPGQGGNEQGLGGIVGVVSKSEEESIRVWEGKDRYNEWLFVFGMQQRPGLPQQPPPAAPKGSSGGVRPPSPRLPPR